MEYLTCIECEDEYNNLIMRICRFVFGCCLPGLYPVRAEYVIKCKFEIREMVNIELGKEIEKDVFSSFHERTSQC